MWSLEPVMEAVEEVGEGVGGDAPQRGFMKIDTGFVGQKNLVDPSLDTLLIRPEYSLLFDKIWAEWGKRNGCSAIIDTCMTYVYRYRIYRLR